MTYDIVTKLNILVFFKICVNLKLKIKKIHIFYIHDFKYAIGLGFKNFFQNKYILLIAL